MKMRRRGNIIRNWRGGELSLRRKKRRKKEERRRRRKKYLAVSAVAVLCAAVIAVRLTGLWNGESGIEAERGGYSAYQMAGNGNTQGEQIDELKALEQEYPKLDEVVNNISDYPQEAVNMFLTNRETIDYLTDYPKEPREKSYDAYQPRGLSGEDSDAAAMG